MSPKQLVDLAIRGGQPRNEAQRNVDDYIKGRSTARARKAASAVQNYVRSGR